MRRHGVMPTGDDTCGKKPAALEIEYTHFVFTKKKKKKKNVYSVPCCTLR
jgi:hypothetical protein